VKLPAWIAHWQSVCAAHGLPGDTREGKGRHQFRLLGKRIMTFEFRPYRWVFYRFDREAFLREADPKAWTNAPPAGEAGPSPCGVFTGTMPADDEALQKLMDQLVTAVAAGRLAFVKKETTGDGAAVAGEEG
jgi:hypothetical protein